MAPENALPTCGEFFKDVLLAYTDGDPEKVRIFDAGVTYGEAEKVYLGACLAAMFRPTDQNFNVKMESCIDIAQGRFALSILIIATSRGREIWICRPGNEEAVRRLLYIKENSPEWHTARGILCGIPLTEIDPLFHLRSGWGQPTS